MIRNLNSNEPGKREVISALATMARTREWQMVVKPYLEDELHNLDVCNRTAEPYQSTRFGAAAQTLQAVIDKFEKSINILHNKTNSI